LTFGLTSLASFPPLSVFPFSWQRLVGHTVAKLHAIDENVSVYWTRPPFLPPLLFIVIIQMKRSMWRGIRLCRINM
jgi:hypothetical protein